MPWGAGLPRTGRLDTWTAGQLQEGAQGSTLLKLLYWGSLLAQLSDHPTTLGPSSH